MRDIVPKGRRKKNGETFFLKLFILFDLNSPFLCLFIK